MGTGMFTTTFGASSNPCLFCSASDEPGCSCSSRAFCWGPGCAFPPVFYLDFHPPRPPQITKSPSQASKLRWEIPAMTGVISVPFSCQDSTQSTFSLGIPWNNWALTIFFFNFFPLPLAFPLLRKGYLAFVGQPEPFCRRKARRRLAASRPKGWVQGGSKHT